MNNTGEKGYYPVVNINEGKYYEIDVPFRLLEVRKLRSGTISQIFEELLCGSNRYELLISAGNEMFHPYVTLTNSEYKILQDSINNFVRVTIYNIVENDTIFVKSIKIEMDGKLKTLPLY